MPPGANPRASSAGYIPSSRSMRFRSCDTTWRVQPLFRALGVPRAFSAFAIALRLVSPPACNSRMRGRSSEARASALAAIDTSEDACALGILPARSPPSFTPRALAAARPAFTRAEWLCSRSSLTALCPCGDPTKAAGEGDPPAPSDSAVPGAPVLPQDARSSIIIVVSPAPSWPVIFA